MTLDPPSRLKQEIRSYNDFVSEAEIILRPDTNVDYEIFCLGYNDAGTLKRASGDILADAKKSVSIAQKLFPRAKIVILEVLNTFNSQQFDQTIEEINRGLRSITQEVPQSVLSKHPLLTPSDKDNIFHPDGTHLNKRGQLQLASDLRRASLGLPPLKTLARSNNYRNNNNRQGQGRQRRTSSSSDKGREDFHSGNPTEPNQRVTNRQRHEKERRSPQYYDDEGANRNAFEGNRYLWSSHYDDYDDSHRDDAREERDRRPPQQDRFHVDNRKRDRPFSRYGNNGWGQSR